MKAIEGKVWKFGDNIDTDLIVPGQYLDAPMEEIVKHVLASVNPDFVKEVKRGDIIIAGRNFGCGSSRENAPGAIKELGISCIVAESFARIFFRNAIAIGLPIISCTGVSDAFEDGDIAHIEIQEASVENRTKKQSLKAENLSDEMISILSKGGILELLKERVGKKKP
jgi:3-isopropylmalate dehydratase small subunit